jgi:hypothetical protein
LNYEFWLAGDGGNLSDTLLFTTFLEEWSRPTVGQQITIKNKMFEVVRTDPSSNPGGQLVKFYIEPINPQRPFKQGMTHKEGIEVI